MLKLGIHRLYGYLVLWTFHLKLKSGHREIQILTFISIRALYVMVI